MTENDISKHLRTNAFGRPCHCFQVLDSTNTHARELAASGAGEGTVVLAEEQRAGRGRLGRSWHSAPGENLTFSCILRPELRGDRIGLLSLYAGLSVAEAIEERTGLHPSCKWPNDLLLNGKKCCGILSEGMFSAGSLAAVIVGIGLNVNQQRFPETIEATSLSLAGGRSCDRGAILASILEKLELHAGELRRGETDPILQGWLRRTTIIGREITVELQGTRFRGIATAVESDGGLVVTAEGSRRKVFAGDVTILLPA